MEFFAIILSGLARRWSVWLSVVILVLAAFGKWESSLMPAKSSIPTVSMPNPNARTYFDAASALLSSDSYIGSISNGPGMPPEHRDSEVLDSAGSAKLLPEKESYAKENQAALEKVRKGLKYTYTPAVPTSFYMISEFPPLHDLALLICIDGEVRAAHRDYSGAMADYLDCIEYATKIQTVGDSIDDSLGRTEIRHILPNLSAAEARASAVRLIQIDESRSGAAQTAEFEKIWTQLSLLSTFKQPHWRGNLFGYSNFGMDGQQDTLSNRLKYIGWRFEDALLSPRSLYNNYTSLMNDAISRISKPWPLYKASPGQIPKADSFSMSLASELDFLYPYALFDLARDHFLEVDMALHAYKVGHGHYPVNLQLLVPAYIPKIPTDPFTDQKPLRYRLKSNGSFLLYSVGPDGIDNGGDPMTGNMLVSKGDIIDGVRL